MNLPKPKNTSFILSSIHLFRKHLAYYLLNKILTLKNKIVMDFRAKLIKSNSFALNADKETKWKYYKNLSKSHIASRKLKHNLPSCPQHSPLPTYTDTFNPAAGAQLTHSRVYKYALNIAVQHCTNSSLQLEYTSHS